MANLKSIVDLPLVESSEGLNLIVNDNGAAKQIAASKVGGNGVSSWNDLLDKPFYTEVLETIEVTVPAKIDDNTPGASDLQNFPIYDSAEQVNIKINGVNQPLIFVQDEYKILTDSLEEPTFGVLQAPDHLTYAQNFTDQDIILSYDIEKIHPIDQKYIPYGVVHVDALIKEFDWSVDEHTIPLSVEEWNKKVEIVNNPFNKVVYNSNSLVFTASESMDNLAFIGFEIIDHTFDEQYTFIIVIKNIGLIYNFETNECTLHMGESIDYRLSRYVPTSS